ncbi:DUF943 family protein [Rosenbergiella sp. S61]|uniref:DUF943 family protein n=1 Tax=Rosenbergiella gaditana TaxID=2726987 RepID=A0ABS5SV17_9GAMM|nr:DUF943 family protein [Rosenbergiella gaditana]MBT0723949.1 DUF943 family protein [Rosenbergiella gaditana]
MRVKNKKTIVPLFLAGCVLLGYWLWLSLRPVEIIAIHHRSSGFSDVLVTSFPPTDKGKINWWLKNKDRLKDKYGIPKPDSDGYFYVTFWMFGEGYKKEGKYDRLCFDDMKKKVNCIEKDAVFSVDKSRNMGVMFTVYDGDNYRLDHNGDIIKVASD